MNSGKRLEGLRTILAELRTLRGPAIITILTVSCGVAGDHARVLLRFDRGLLAEGQFWRLATGHLVHLGTGHMLLNICGLVGLALVLRPLRPTGSWWLITGLLAGAAVDAGLYWLEPGVAWYVGLSGVLHGFWAAGGSALLATRDRSFGAAVVGVLLVKLGYENWPGAAGINEALLGGDVITAAHIYGAAGGFFAAGVIRLARKHHPQTRNASL